MYQIPDVGDDEVFERFGMHLRDKIASIDELRIKQAEP